MIKKNKSLLVIIGLLLLVFLSSYNPIETGQKESIAEWGKVGVGIGLIILAIVVIVFTAGAGTPVAIPILGVGILVAFGSGSLFGGIAGLLTPDASIPGWLWLVAGFILIIMLLKSKK